MGYRGEKAIFKILSKKFSGVIWLNKEKESHQPYNLTYIANGKTFYLEVKSSINNNQSFTISENELNFAKEHLDNYILFHIINVGTEDMAYREFTEFYKKYKEKFFKCISTVLEF